MIIAPRLSIVAFLVSKSSFNENEPIMNSPQEAYACYARTAMDILVMENCLVKRDLP